MSVIPTDKNFFAVKAALVTIANGLRKTDGGRRTRMSRGDMETIAREACDKMGWPYYEFTEADMARAAASGLGRTA